MSNAFRFCSYLGAVGSVISLQASAAAQVPSPGMFKLDLNWRINTSYYNPKFDSYASVLVSDDWSRIALTSSTTASTGDNRAVSWTRATGTQSLGDFGTQGTYLHFMDRTGTNLYGQYMAPGFSVNIFNWQSTSGFTNTGRTTNNQFGFSSDGTTAFMPTLDTNGNLALRKWNSGGSSVSNPLGTSNALNIKLVSPNGSAVAATQQNGAGLDAYWWNGQNNAINIGTLGGDQTTVDQMSSNGVYLAGTSYTAQSLPQAYRWSEVGGMQRLVPASMTQYTRSNASQMSSDGNIVFGFLEQNSFKNRLFRWTSSDGFTDLGHLGSGNASSRFMKSDGTKVFGESGLADFSPRAFVWTSTGGMVDLGLSNMSIINFKDVSEDYSKAIIGARTTSNQDRLYMVDSSNVVTQLVSPDSGNLTLWDANSTLTKMFVSTSRTYFWQEGTGFQSMGSVNGVDITSIDAIAPDFSMAGGAVTISGVKHAYIWDPVNGAVDLKAVLISKGVDMTGWDSLNKIEILENYMGAPHIIGQGTFNGVNGYKFHAVVPEPGSVIALLAGIGFLGRRRARQKGSKRVSA